MIQADSPVLFLLPGRRTYLKIVRPGEKFHTHKGIIAIDEVIGRSYGDVIRTHTGEPVVLLEPTLEDVMMKIQRRTQIIYPKEAAMIVLKTGLREGYRVLEVGSGTGALTLALANAVGEAGRVFAYDRVAERLEKARDNLRWMGMTNTIEFKPANEPDRYDEREVDVAVVDIPEPWTVVGPVYESLKGGGRWVSLSPTYNQVERAAIALEEGGFVFLETIEVLTRTILARSGRTRPFERMVGHTGFLTFGRKSNERLVRCEEASSTAEEPKAEGLEGDATCE
ncbi:MAG: tRNA (adenine-N1)-methyltransferase [Nitrospirae bacterium]|nr:tRNA (adenine-N1)-methyltransferase [Nitrospirota bacterium]